MKKLLVTGVPGWLSSRFLESIHQSPLAGIGSVRCMAQSDDVLRSDSFRREQCSDHEYVAADLRAPGALTKALRGVDVVLHTAGILHVSRTREWYEVNGEGTRSLVAAAAEAGVARVVYVSTNAAAGRSRSKERLLTEADPPRPISHYGKSKLLGERFVSECSSRLETVILRPCMFYGRPVPARHVDVYRRIQKGVMPLVGGGDHARSLTHIDNLVQACRLAAERPEAVGQTYYISDDEVYTTRSVMEAMAEAIGVELRTIRVPAVMSRLALAADLLLAAGGRYWQNMHLLGEGDWHVGVSCEKAMRELGYRPTVRLREGMRSAVAWCRERGLLA